MSPVTMSVSKTPPGPGGEFGVPRAETRGKLWDSSTARQRGADERRRRPKLGLSQLVRTLGTREELV
jgi:hypothetical protein